MGNNALGQVQGLMSMMGQMRQIEEDERQQKIFREGVASFDERARTDKEFAKDMKAAELRNPQWRMNAQTFANFAPTVESRHVFRKDIVEMQKQGILQDWEVKQYQGEFDRNPESAMGNLTARMEEKHAYIQGKAREANLQKLGMEVDAGQLPIGEIERRLNEDE